jgi:hypothetical protein
MDAEVRKALARWPNVPACYGWLRLSARGEWLIGMQAERITHRGLSDFIDRNYAHDARGAWFFQNGPQKVYVALDYTPIVYRLSGRRSESLETHTGQAVGQIESAYLDERGALLLVTAAGPGVVCDRDLSALVEYLVDASGQPLSEAQLEALATNPYAYAGGIALAILAQRIPLHGVLREDAPRKFGFVRNPCPE